MRVWKRNFRRMQPSTWQTLSVHDAQALLGVDEALVQFVETSNEVFVWVVTKAALRWVRLDLDAAALKSGVTAPRCGLEASL